MAGALAVVLATSGGAALAVVWARIRSAISRLAAWFEGFWASPLGNGNMHLSSSSGSAGPRRQTRSWCAGRSLFVGFTVQHNSARHRDIPDLDFHGAFRELLSRRPTGARRKRHDSAGSGAPFLLFCIVVILPLVGCAIVRHACSCCPHLLGGGGSFPAGATSTSHFHSCPFLHFRPFTAASRTSPSRRTTCRSQTRCCPR